MSSPFKTCGFPPEIVSLWVSYAEFGSGVAWFIYASFTLIRYLETGQGLWIYTAVAVPLRILAHFILGFVLYKGVTKRKTLLLKCWLFARGILLALAIILMIITLSFFSAPHEILWPVIVWDVIYWIAIIWSMSVVFTFRGQLEIKAIPKSSNNTDPSVSVLQSQPQSQSQLNMTGISNPTLDVQELDGGFGLTIGHI